MASVAWGGRLRARRVELLIVLVACVAFMLATLHAEPARASVSIAVSWEGLLRESTAAAIVTPVDAQAVWEDGRIYTYTRVHVDRGVAGPLSAGADAWVRTMGGIVGNVGQQVEGEAVLPMGSPSLLFLRPGPATTYEVTARGQGQFPVVAGDPHAPAHVVRSRAMGMIVPPRAPVPAAPPRFAADVLHGLAVDDAAREVSSAWDRTHAQ